MPTYRGITLPDHLREGLDRYAHERIPTGGFLYAVLCNDLFEAVCRADAESLAALPAVCGYVYNELPSKCWGSEVRVAAWLHPHDPGRAVRVEATAK